MFPRASPLPWKYPPLHRNPGSSSASPAWTEPDRKACWRLCSAFGFGCRSAAEKTRNQRRPTFFPSTSPTSSVPSTPSANSASTSLLVGTYVLATAQGPPCGGLPAARARGAAVADRPRAPTALASPPPPPPSPCTSARPRLAHRWAAAPKDRSSGPSCCRRPSSRRTRSSSPAPKPQRELLLMQRGRSSAKKASCGSSRLAFVCSSCAPQMFWAVHGAAQGERLPVVDCQRRRTRPWSAIDDS
mmetsp:Transcript_144862/g.464307  ORF Transcript_144862/g.464307 Transcript_144862/m.464307 type:complete len:244 (-) Transcript_144862:101-832(-)